MAASSREAYSSLLNVLAEQLGSAPSLHETSRHFSITPQEGEMPEWFASKQLLTTGEPQLLLSLLCL
jgi:hypothetical protein